MNDFILINLVKSVNLAEAIQNGGETVFCWMVISSGIRLPKEHKDIAIKWSQCQTVGCIGVAMEMKVSPTSVDNVVVTLKSDVRHCFCCVMTGDLF